MIKITSAIALARSATSRECVLYKMQPDSQIQIISADNLLVEGDLYNICTHAVER